MKSNFLISLVIIISHFGFSQNKVINDTLIEWGKTNKLKWSDFKGKPVKDPIYVVAETQCHIKYTDSYYDNNGIPKFSIKCFFSKNESWTITSDVETLKHEQLHFDLWELITRKIRKAFLDLNAKSEKNTSLYFKKYSEMIKYGSELQNLYDNESYFNKEMQDYWSEKITKELKKLNKYT